MLMRGSEPITRSDRFYRSLVEHSLDALLVHDDKGYITFASPSVEQVLGYPAAAMTGQHITEIVHPEDRPPLERAAAAVGEAGDTVPTEIRVRHGDGSWRTVAGIGRRLPKDCGAAVVVSLRDVTAYREIERALRQSERRFRDLAESTSDLLWEIDQNLAFTYVGPKLRDLLGYEPKEWMGRAPFEFMAPEEAARVARLIGHTLAAREPFDRLENDLLHKDGRVVSIETSAVPVFDEQGVFRGYRGIDRDITERKRIESESDTQAELVDLLFRLASVANEAEDVAEATAIFLDEICAFTAWPIGHAWQFDPDRPDTPVSSNIWHLDDAGRFAPFREASLDPAFDLGLGLPGRVLAGGVPVWVRSRQFETLRARVALSLGLETAFGMPVLIGREVVGILEFFTPGLPEPDRPFIQVMNSIGTLLGRVVERERHLRTLEVLAQHDPLTGLANLRLGRELVEAAFARARRDRTKAALLFLDLDGFKAVNDRLGHDAGDAVLKEVAVRLSAGMRATDSVMRIGGDEFLVLLTDVRDNATVARLAGKLIEAIRAPFHCCPETVSIGASIGIAVFPDHDMTAEELIKRADEAMYAVKQECKNGYRFA